MGIFRSSRDRRRAMERWHDELASGTERSRHRLEELGSDANEHLGRARVRLGNDGRRAYEYGQRRAYDLDRHVHDNSWSYIAAGTAAGLIAGILLGRRR